jgi:hypothetical protein
VWVRVELYGYRTVYLQNVTITQLSSARTRDFRLINTVARALSKRAIGERHTQPLSLWLSVRYQSSQVGSPLVTRPSLRCWGHSSDSS